MTRGAGPKLANPSFLAIHPNQKLLYAVNEMDEFNGQNGGGVSTLAIDPASGTLRLLSQQSSRGRAPCHLIVDRAGKNVLVANYNSGSVACFPIRADGTLGAASSLIQHHGKSIDPVRQEGPHAHSIYLDRANKFALVTDLGLDQIFVDAFDASRGTLVPNIPALSCVSPGSGPRHLDFHPSGQYIYVINELANTISAFTYDAEKGTLKAIQTISTLPADYQGTSLAAEVQVHPSGRFAYASNRGHDSIAVFTVDAVTGALSPAGHQSTRGKNPRNFAIDPSGAYLLAANQDSDSIVVFAIDQQTGSLTRVGEPVSIPMPVCIQWYPASTIPSALNQ
jgi:6-phosphogluconolactonase